MRIPPKLKLRGNFDDDVGSHFRRDKSPLNTSVLSEGPVMKDLSSQGSMHVPADDHPTYDLSAKLMGIDHQPLFNKLATDTPGRTKLSDNRRESRKFLVQTLAATEQRNTGNTSK